MSMIEDIRKDREAGTPGPWMVDYTGDTYYIECEPGFNHAEALNEPDASRIVRVPGMEAALLAAEELADAVDEWGAKGRTPATAAALNTALGNYRAATEGKA